MPKGKRKGGRSDRGRYDNSLQTSDDDSYNNNDNNSVISNYSENNKSQDDEENVGDELAQEQFEEKLIDVLEGLNQKSSQGRTNCLQSLSKALIKKFIPNFVRERHYTIYDSIEKSLKKGTSLEKLAAIDLAILISIQLGEDEETNLIINKTIKPLLISMACDNTVSPVVRAKCCTGIGTISFICQEELGDILLIMQQLETIFSASYLKGDGTIVVNITNELANLHASALSAWTLLLTNLAQGNITSMLNNKTLPSLKQLSELFESPHLEVRLTAGEALSIIIEEGRKENIDFADNFLIYITDVLKQLATDSHKYRAKKDRKQQRATFRDILQFIEDDLVPDVNIKFGRETLILDTWTKRKQYDALCSILGPGINLHLTENDLIRDIFEIQINNMLKNETPAHAQQMERYRKRLMNAAAFKARTISRGKNRDKRSDF